MFLHKAGMDGLVPATMIESTYHSAPALQASTC